jgi:hypothetical protein
MRAIELTLMLLTLQFLDCNTRFRRSSPRSETYQVLCDPKIELKDNVQIIGPSYIPIIVNTSSGGVCKGRNAVPIDIQPEGFYTNVLRIEPSRSGCS